MTTPAQQKRMQEAELDDDIMSIGQLLPEVACKHFARVASEVHRARSEEGRLTSELSAAEKLTDAVAAEMAEHILGRVQAVEERDAEKLRGDGYREVACGFAFDLGRSPPLGRSTCVYCGESAEPLATQEAEFARWRAHALVCPKHPMREVERQRDAAMSDEQRVWDGYTGALQELRRILKPGPDEKLDDAAERVVAERDTARADVERLTRERDEARTDASRLAKDVGDACADAREEIERLRILLAAHHVSGALDHQIPGRQCIVCDEQEAANAK